MDTKNPPLNPWIARAAAGLVVILSFVGLQAWEQYEKKRASDTQLVAELLITQTALIRFYRDFASYPASPQGPRQIGTKEASCVSRDGFVSPESLSCKTHAYLRGAGRRIGARMEGVTYQGTDGEGKECGHATACPSYAIRFSLQSNMFGAGGEHLLTPQGFQ